MSDVKGKAEFLEDVNLASTGSIVCCDAATTIFGSP